MVVSPEPAALGEDASYSRKQSLVKQFGQDDEERDRDADDLGRLQVEGVDLVAQARGEAGVLNRLQARAVDVPDAALPDVS